MKMIREYQQQHFIREKSGIFRQLHFFSLAISLSLLIFLELGLAQTLSPKDLLKMRYVSGAQISPNGEWVAYTLHVPRKATEKPGAAYNELYLLSIKNGNIHPFITGRVNVSSIAWHPNGKSIAFLLKRDGDEKTQVWQIRTDGGEAQKITHSETEVLQFKWHPDGQKIAYVAKTPESNKEKYLKEKGYDFIFYEEGWKHRNLYLLDINDTGIHSKPEQLTRCITVWSFIFSPDGNKIAAALSDKNLIDYKYMFQKIHLLDLQTKKLTQLTQNPGKLGNFAFNPDGKKLAYTAALRQNDHAVSQVYVISTSGGTAKNLTIPEFKGHVDWVGWKNTNTIIYKSGEGVWTTLSSVNIKGGKRKILLHSQESKIIFSAPSYTKGFKQAIVIGNTPNFPREVFAVTVKKGLKRLTHSNLWLESKSLGQQESIKYKARDHVEIEGLLIYPVNYQKGKKYPLIVIVHGGPESHYSNGWITSYSRPGQILAGRGYLVFYPNYRASTGYGLEYAMKWHYGNPAGTEFDDIADGIDYLINAGLADKDRVGLGGGSYGGFAAAWYASYYTNYVKAVCMFVGISDLISKRGTTDIPYEELYVHSGKKLENMWDLSLKRSPIYYAHQSKTAVLIFGGSADTRVSPSQSKEFYHRLKMNDHPAVRLVQYPGEGHGNRKQPGRIDVLYRILDWYDWYVKDAKPLDGPLPPLDISDKYGLEIPNE